MSLMPDVELPFQRPMNAPYVGRNRKLVDALLADTAVRRIANFGDGEPPLH